MKSLSVVVLLALCSTSAFAADPFFTITHTPSLDLAVKGFEMAEHAKCNAMQREDLELKEVNSEGATASGTLVCYPDLAPGVFSVPTVYEFKFVGVWSNNRFKLVTTIISEVAH